MVDNGLLRLLIDLFIFLMKLHLVWLTPFLCFTFRHCLWSDCKCLCLKEVLCGKSKRKQVQMSGIIAFQTLLLS